MNRLRYQPPEEATANLAAVADLILSNVGIMANIALLHAVGRRGAAVVFLDSAGGFQDGIATSNLAIDEQFPFAPVRELLASYDPEKSVCLVMVRGGAVSAFLTSQRGKRASTKRKGPQQ